MSIVIKIIYNKSIDAAMTHDATMELIEDICDANKDIIPKGASSVDKIGVIAKGAYITGYQMAVATFNEAMEISLSQLEEKIQDSNEMSQK